MWNNPSLRRSNNIRAGGDAWNQNDIVRQYERKIHQKSSRKKSTSNRSSNIIKNIKVITLFLMNVIYRIIRMMIFSPKFTHHMAFQETNTMNTIQTYGVWFYETYIKTTVYKVFGERVIRYSYGFFFQETPFTQGLLWNLIGMFSLVFVLAMAFYPIITFLSVVIALFILVQTIVNQGIVNYFYYFSNNKNSG
ncbi:hypothetical protein ACFFRR_010271 [Megaselia abdita]